MTYYQKGLTLLEIVIASSLVVLLIGVIAFQYKSENHQAEQVIAQLQMAKAGVLRYNLNDPKSTNKLADLVRPNDANPENWNGPYIDTATRLTPEGQIDISNIFPESHVELEVETIGETTYQVVLLKGIAETELKNSILAKCGDCKPLPGRDDIGLLVQQFGVVAQSGTVFKTDTVAAVGLPLAAPPSPWMGPNTNIGPTITTTPQMPNVPNAVVTPPPPVITPPPSTSVPTTNPTPPSPSPDLPINYAPPVITQETKNGSCPAGYSGNLVQSRNKVYERGITTYTPWVNYINTCTPPPPPPPPPPSDDGGGGGGGPIRICSLQCVAYGQDPTYGFWTCTQMVEYECWPK